MIKEIIDEEKINKILEETKNPSKNIILKIFKKAREKKGLELKEVGYLVNLRNSGLKEELFDIASKIKDEIYGERLVFFAPLYISDYCVNDCEYCNFHIRNKGFKRKKLSLDKVKEQVNILINMGHKRLLLEFGEDPVNNNIDYVVKVIETVYSVKTNKGNIRRVNINIAATTTENYKKLKSAHIGTYQLFQETYHRATYEKLHNGLKSDYERQITAHNKAYEGGIDDRGLGVLFGLYDWRFEVLGLVSHSQYLDRKDNVGPHTVSIPRFCPAPTVIYKPEYPVSDEDFLKLIAILRISIPYTGMIISTREKPNIRKIAFKIGISQASAASCTVTGGYGKGNKNMQFEIHDKRKIEEIIRDTLDDKLLPSFCTACYRKGRTGENFMNFSKPGEIHNFCRPNGLLTFAEYLEDFASSKLYKKGYEVIDFYLNKIKSENLKRKIREYLKRMREGERDLYF